MYRVYQMVIADAELNNVFSDWSFVGHSLYNEALYIIRNLFTGLGKNCKDLTVNEKDVIDAVFKAFDEYDSTGSLGSSCRLPSFKFLLHYISNVVKSKNYYSSLPRHTAQHLIKQAILDFKHWLKALKAWKKDKSSFTGKPKMPRYKKESSSFKISNQEAVIYKGKFGSELKLPRQKKRLPLGMDFTGKRLKEVTVTRYYGVFRLSLVMEEEKEIKLRDKSIKAGIDFGINNLAAISTNNGKSLLVKGEFIKARNQWFNKQIAKNLRGQTVGTTNKAISSKKLNALYKKRENLLKDTMHKVSKKVVAWCIENSVGLIVLGRTRYWKQNVNMGKANNQGFAQIPIHTLIEYIKYKAIDEGIEVVEQEESYTSQSSFLDMDDIPIYRKGNTDSYTFSGKRIKRGLYKTGDNIINADLNAACNILRKAYPQESFYLNDIGYLKSPVVMNVDKIYR